MMQPEILSPKTTPGGHILAGSVLDLSTLPKVDFDAVKTYQSRTISDLTKALHGGIDAALRAPVGSGKTRMSIKVMQEEIASGGRAIVLQGHEQLLMQNVKKAQAAGLKTSIAADGQIDRSGDVIYGLVQTCAKDPASLGPVSLLVIDEGHHAKDDDNGLYSRFIDDLVKLNPGMRLMPMSGTLDRHDAYDLHPRIRNAANIQVLYKEVIECGMLLPPKTVQCDTRLTDGSYFQDEIRQRLDPKDPSRSAVGLNALFQAKRSETAMTDIAAHFVKVLRLEGKSKAQTLGFADRIKDATEIATALQAQGMKAEVLHSKMPAKLKNKVVADYHAEKIQAIISVDMIGEGFDAANTQAILNAKTTVSANEHIQIVGRLTRGTDGKDAGLFVDFGASTAMHGRIEVLAAVEAYTAGVKIEPNSKLKPFQAWTKLAKLPSGQTVYGMDTGDKTYFLHSLDPASDAKFQRYQLSETQVSRDGKSSRIVPLQQMNRAQLAKFSRQEVHKARRSIVSLVSSLDAKGESWMERRLKASYAKYQSSLQIIAAHSAQTAAAASKSGRQAGIGL